MSEPPPNPSNDYNVLQECYEVKTKKAMQRRRDNSQSRLRLSMSNVSNRMLTYTLHCVIKQETTKKASSSKQWRGKGSLQALLDKKHTHE